MIRKPVHTIQDLLRCSEGEVAHAEFKGDHWSGLLVRNQVVEAGELGLVELEDVRRILPALMARSRLVQDGVAPEQVLVESCYVACNPGADQVVEPNPLLAAALLVTAHEHAPGNLRSSEIAILLELSDIVLHGLVHYPGRHIELASYIHDISQALRREGQVADALRIAEAGVRIVEDAAVRALSALPDLMDCLYDAKCDELDGRQIVGVKGRVAVADEMLILLERKMSPAVAARNAFFKHSTSAKVSREVRRGELAHRHRVLTWKTSRSRALHRWGVDEPSEWILLSEAYSGLGDRPGAVNAARALGAGIDSLVESLGVQRGTKEHQEHAKEMLFRMIGLLRESLGACPATWLTESERRDSTLQIVKALVAAKDLTAAGAQMLEVNRSLLDQLEAANDPGPKYFMSSADDCLGWWLRISGPDSPGFKEAYRIVRGRELPALEFQADVSVLRLYLTRVGSWVHLASAGDKHMHFAEGQDSHQLASTLKEIDALVWAEIRKVTKTFVPPANGNQWRKLVNRLMAQAGIRKMERLMVAQRRVVVEADGLAAHLVTGGAVLDICTDVKGIAMARLGHIPNPLPLPSNSCGVIIDCFEQGEPWSDVLKRMAQRLNLPRVAVSGPDQLLEQFNVGKSLYVLGAHGSQDGIAGPLAISVAGKPHPVHELLSRLKLGVGSTVLAATCWASTGLSLAGGAQWLSLPELFLEAGARWVVANRWPVWTEPKVERAFQDLARDLLSESTSEDPWSVPERATAFMKKVCTMNADPRLWAGWGAWTTKCVLGLG